MINVSVQVAHQKIPQKKGKSWRMFSLICWFYLSLHIVLDCWTAANKIKCSINYKTVTVPCEVSLNNTLSTPRLTLFFCHACSILTFPCPALCGCLRWWCPPGRTTRWCASACLGGLTPTSRSTWNTSTSTPTHPGSPALAWVGWYCIIGTTTLRSSETQLWDMNSAVFLQRNRVQT